MMIVCIQNTACVLHSRERSARKKEGSLPYTRTNDGGLTSEEKRRKKSRNRSPLVHSRMKKASTRTSLLFFVFTSTNLCTVIGERKVVKGQSLLSYYSTTLRKRMMFFPPVREKLNTRDDNYTYCTLTPTRLKLRRRRISAKQTARPLCSDR